MSDAVFKASRGLMRDFGEVEKLQVSRKGANDFVSEADKKCERTLVKELKKARPSYSFLLEEGGELEGEDKTKRWIIDPLDGTNNFLHGLPFFCISIGLEEDGEITAGVIYVPLLNDLYWTVKDKGAFLNNGSIDHILRVSNRKNTDGMIVSCSYRNNTNALQNIIDKGYVVRFIGSCAMSLAFVAAGKIDVAMEDNIKTWDTAAGVLLVKEAGGIVSQVGGKEYKLEHGNILATNGIIHNNINKIITNEN